MIKDLVKSYFMKKPIVNFLEPSQQQFNSLLELYQTGKYTDTEKLAVSITQEFPEQIGRASCRERV